MTWIDPRLWGALLLAVVIGVAAGYWKGHHDADQSATVSSQAKQIKDLADANNLYRQTTQTLAGISIDAKKTADIERAAARAADASADGLRKQVAELVASARDSTPTDGGAAISDAAGMLADMFGELEGRTRTYARTAETAHNEGFACERSYDALSKKDNASDQK